MEKKLISVIVPVYNVEAYLERCVDSILKQTYKELEIILVDDGPQIAVENYVINLQKKMIELLSYTKRMVGSLMQEMLG